MWKTSAEKAAEKLSRETAKSKDQDSTKSREKDREAITSSDRRLKNENRKGHRNMPTDNTGVKTRAMAQRTDSEPQEAQNQNVNPTVEPYKNKDESIKDFVRKHGTIALDWYVPNFSNARVGDLIEQRLPIETADDRIVFSCPTLSEFFKTSNFELDLKTGQVFTYLSPPENIGISCQKDPFDLELLRNMLREEQDISMTQEEA